MTHLEVSAEGKERLNRFFVKLLSEVQVLAADSVIFEADRNALRIIISKAGAGIRESTSRLSWFEAIYEWLWQHVSPAWVDKNPRIRSVPDRFWALVQIETRSCEFEVYTQQSDPERRSIRISAFTDQVAVCSMDKMAARGPHGETDIIEVSDDFFMSEAKLVHDKLGIKRQRPLILLVEDDPDQRSIIKMVLTEANYDIAIAGDGIEAQEILSRESPDLIITDIMMPHMDGPELVRFIKDDPTLKSIPILVLTVLGDAEKEYTLLSLGVDDYCEKTMQRKILLKRIENLLRRAKQAQGEIGRPQR